MQPGNQQRSTTDWLDHATNSTDGSFIGGCIWFGIVGYLGMSKCTDVTEYRVLKTTIY